MGYPSPLGNSLVKCWSWSGMPKVNKAALKHHSLDSHFNQVNLTTSLGIIMLWNGNLLQITVIATYLLDRKTFMCHSCFGMRVVTFQIWRAEKELTLTVHKITLCDEWCSWRMFIFRHLSQILVNFKRAFNRSNGNIFSKTLVT